MNTSDNDQTAHLLSQALHDEAAGSSPSADGLAAIQARTATSDQRGARSWFSSTNRSRTTGSWPVAVLGAGLATAAVITTVVVVGNQGSDNSAPPAVQPTTTEEREPTPSAPAPTQTSASAPAPTSTQTSASEPSNSTSTEPSNEPPDTSATTDPATRAKAARIDAPDFPWTNDLITFEMVSSEPGSGSALPGEILQSPFTDLGAEAVHRTDYESPESATLAAVQLTAVFAGQQQAAAAADTVLQWQAAHDPYSAPYTVPTEVGPASYWFSSNDRVAPDKYSGWFIEEGFVVDDDTLTYLVVESTGQDYNVEFGDEAVAQALEVAARALTASRPLTQTTPDVADPIDRHEGFYDANAPADRQVTMYYVGPNGRLYAEPHTLSQAPDDPTLAAVQEWWTSTAIDPDLAPVLVASEGVVVGVTTEGSAATIAVEGPGAPGLGGNAFFAGDHRIGSPQALHEQDLLLYQALLRTAGIQEARFTYNGKLVDESNGVRLDPLQALPDDRVRAWIDIVDIVEGQTVANPVTVTVSGNVFEGTVNWELYDEGGSKLDDGFVTTAFTSWREADIELGTLEPGRYRVRCLEYSAADGGATNVVDKTFTVQ